MNISIEVIKVLLNNHSFIYLIIYLLFFLFIFCGIFQVRT